LEKMGPSCHIMKNKKSEINMFRPIGSNKSPVYRGNPNFLYFPLSACQIWWHPLVEDHQPTYFTNLKKQKKTLF
jgi:hypothetical protein